MVTKIPDKTEVLRLLAKLHDINVPNWTSQDQINAYDQLQSLAFHWFRCEVPNISNEKHTEYT